MSIIVDKKLFININTIGINDKQRNRFLVSFESFCEKVYQLLVDEKIPINIKIFLKLMQKQYNPNGIDECRSIFLRYFAKKKVLLKYEEPNCDKMICQALKKPKLLLDLDKYEPLFHVSNCKQQ